MTERATREHDAVAQIGQVVAERYEIRKHLGTGGFAKVYRAFDMRIERDVAIKFLNLRGMHVSDSAVYNILERFEREAKLAARIPHRNVVNIYDIGQVDEDPFKPFIVMELLQGMDMDQFMSTQGAMAPKRLLPLFVDCLDALGKAHEAGIVHKDLKPSNLFLSDPGQRSEALRIVDFGIAHIKGGGEGGSGGNRLTATGQILGTLQYLTPEYIASQIVSPALDVYQMGLILVELLTGRPVIETDNAFECLRIHTFGLLELPEYLLLSPLGPVLRQALESDHVQRYQDAAAFADALSQIPAEAIPATPDELKTTRVAAVARASTSAPPVAVTSEHGRPTTGELRADDPARMDLADTMAPQPVSAFGASSPAQAVQQAAPVGAALAAVAVARSTDELAPPIASAREAHHHATSTSLDSVELDAPPAPAMNVKLIGGVLVVAILVSLGVLIALLASKGDKQDPPQPPVASTSDSTVAAPVAPRDVKPVAQPVAQPTPDLGAAASAAAADMGQASSEVAPPVKPDASPAPPKGTVKLTVLPSDAAIIFKNRRVYGEFSHTFGPKERSIKVRVEAPGYIAQDLTLSPSQGKLVVSLEPTKAEPIKPDSDVARALDAFAGEAEAEAEAKKLRALEEERRRQELAKKADEAAERARREAEATERARREAEAAERARREAEAAERARREAEAKAKQTPTVKIAD